MLEGGGNQHIRFLGAWSALLVHNWFTPSEEPKSFVSGFLRNPTTEVGPWKRPFSMVRLHDPPAQSGTLPVCDNAHLPKHIFIYGHQTSNPHLRICVDYT